MVKRAKWLRLAPKGCILHHMPIRYVTYDRMTALPAPTFNRCVQNLTLGPAGLMQARATQARKQDYPGKVVVAYAGTRVIGWNMRDRLQKVEQFLNPKYRGQGIGANMLARSITANALPFDLSSVYAETPKYFIGQPEEQYYENARRTLRSAMKLQGKI